MVQKKLGEYNILSLFHSRDKCRSDYMLTNMVVLSAILWFRKSDQWGWHESHVKKRGHGLGETYPKTTHVQCIP